MEGEKRVEKGTGEEDVRGGKRVKEERGWKEGGKREDGEKREKRMRAV